MPPSTTIRGAVAEREQTRQEGQLVKAVEIAEGKIRASRGWFDKVAPSHIDADQFVALCLGAVRRGGPNLHRALWQHPETFFDAVSECARLGLVPGEDFYFVPFRDNRDRVGNQENPDKGTYSITGMVGYKGQLDLVYRTGAVTAVHAHVVRAADEFDWEPGPDLPAHKIKANEHGQRGLVPLSQRGELTGTWAFAVMVAGGHSQPAVLDADTVLAYRAKAKTFEFWGGTREVPKEIQSTPAMWRKTGLRRLYDMVPHSTEYRTEMARALAAAHTDPLPGSNPAAIGSADEDVEMPGGPVQLLGALGQPLPAAGADDAPPPPDGPR